MKEPTQTANNLSLKLSNIIKEKIKQSGGIISFSKFMQMALYTKDLGYYSNNLGEKFGKNGDFFTAPTLGELFAICLANQLLNIFKDNLPECNILELGAGNGKLAYQIIKHMRHLTSNLSLKLNKYLILEPSITLRERQKDLLLNSDLDQYYKQQILWIDQVPENFIGVIMANEVLDALPVNLFLIKDHQIFEKSVTLKNNEFEFIEITANNSLLKQIKQLPLSQSWQNYTSEICLLIPRLIKSISKRLKQGSLLFFDYGFLENDYYSSHRNCGSLRCYYQHHVNYNPLLWPGLQDITSHVDFSKVIKSATNCDLEVVSFSSLAQFLMNNNLRENFIDCLNNADNQLKQCETHQELATLISPAEMGEIFKTLHLKKD